MPVINPSNPEIAAMLDRVGLLLETQGGDPFRVRAYRSAAETIWRHADPVAALAEDSDALESLPTIGRSIGRAIAQYAKTGHARILDRLEGQVSPEDQFTRIPGVGEVLANQIHRELKLDTLEELEVAAYDGRLERLPGMGPRRILAVRNALHAILGRRSLQDGDVRRTTPRAEPSIATLLEIDAQYRGKAEAGELRTIAPKRFNPEQKAWLPIMHLDFEGWHFTALFSNTERAHELGKTGDWVVIFYERDGDHGQATVVSEPHGMLKGKRVVRGREEECVAHYRQAVEESAKSANPQAKSEALTVITALQ